jgi:phosphohistidine phosphatase
MKLLTLIRHAKSDHGPPLLQDFQRPLSARGLRDAPLIGSHLKTAHAFAPDVVITSPARRAATTASLVLQAAGLEGTPLQEELRIYEAPLHSLVEVVHGLPATARHAVLFGHNPGLELLANWLCGGPVIEGLRTGGVIQLKLDLDHWAGAGPATGTLLAYFYPGQIGGGKQTHAD